MFVNEDSLDEKDNDDDGLLQSTKITEGCFVGRSSYPWFTYYENFKLNFTFFTAGRRIMTIRQ